jgi:diguanylate cyclase (GGDEF)-like protein
MVLPLHGCNLAVSGIRLGEIGVVVKHRASEAGSATTRLHATEEHCREAARRDERASDREEAAAVRERAAQERERKMFLSLERTLATGNSSRERVLACLEAFRREAAWDRACAEEDRREAARDRTQAAEERTEALDALRGAHFDDLTGAYRRGLGKELLRDEIERARRSGGGLALVIADVDGLKEVNDTRGHLAGDELLRKVVAAIRANIRSYEPIVRLGGDEFCFTIAGVTRAGAAERCDLMRAELGRTPDAGFTVGIAELRPDDDLGGLLHRADSALLDSRHSPRRFRSSVHG